ncbi:MAG: hypothetical protein IID16_06170 [Candidatus Marinimicrobia bacterium]|nr:hypothetical protein [Candidatus Neomarinimicrobiota bacterium]
MKKLILIIGLFYFSIAQDIYPYFWDPNKQLEFERRRIYINETEVERQYILGVGISFYWTGKQFTLTLSNKCK